MRRSSRSSITKPCGCSRNRTRHRRMSVTFSQSSGFTPSIPPEEALAPLASANHASLPPSSLKAATMRALTSSLRRSSTSSGAGLAHETSQRDAPSALARDQPSPGGSRSSNADAGCGPNGRHPAHIAVDGGEGQFANGLAVGALVGVLHLFVDGDEPLRRVAEDQRRFRPPRMRDRSGLTRPRAIRAPASASLSMQALISPSTSLNTLCCENLQAANRMEGRRGSSVPSLADIMRSSARPYFTPSIVVIGAVAGRGVNEACSLLSSVDDGRRAAWRTS